MTPPHPKNPLHGVTLAAMLEQLVEQYGWETLSQSIPVRCFTYHPSLKSSLHFLRRTPWARAKVESLYLHYLEEKPAAFEELPAVEPTPTEE
ncbi:VF530 family protein [Schlesneria paludicola]|uniref:VF530 family protein n=1 Tax=Schlesneria paludicola TaxID=360056 RepID=UPI0006827A57|nr:VF530 family protein [Schlesneria paludicola]